LSAGRFPAPSEKERVPFRGRSPAWNKNRAASLDLSLQQKFLGSNPFFKKGWRGAGLSPGNADSSLGVKTDRRFAAISGIAYLYMRVIQKNNISGYVF